MPWNKMTLCLFVLFLAASTAGAQAQRSDVPQSNLTTKSVKAVGFRVNGGSTKVEYRSTPKSAGGRLNPSETVQSEIDGRRLA